MKRPVSGIATDGAHSAKERLTRFRAVDLFSGKELLCESVGNWTNNIGEFLGIIAAVKYILEHPEAPRIIYSDSITAVTWYQNRRTASSRHCPALLKAEIFLKAMEERIKDIRVEHWDNRQWGEIPADFGNKK
ncbi:ribonuclease H family protein [Parabacteroides merdae]|jgi:ribonuclease H|uniref:Ribonuclease H n=1 Tax=Parabacteroides merdae TaxID=46503 RepID=A0AA44ANA7_9BACT|nr:ribonuclease H [Parabacteroides merdae]MTU53603.1 ribonuclease H [Parabacteroides merdae]MTU62061.1 ribonuclease H [Parabacteroides merdae]MTU65810.1 ribonuclease H [Parabacteroides merdae]MTU70145.1 ribonuclease H [Parabacteroides merdae]MTU81569.1 ribonuclease H [Parabacteroides merdae]